MNERERLTWAHRQVESIICFYIHLAVFVPVMALLFVINLASNHFLITFWWVALPFVGWGIGVLAHALAVFRARPTKRGMLANWRLNKIKQIMHAP